MDKIIFATGNEGKMKEVRMILEDLGLPVLSLKDAGITADVEENGTTFEENAQIKAKAIMEMTGALVLADDSGLEVDALDKEPGTIRPAIWDMILPTILRIRILSTGWKEKLEKSAVHVLYARLQLHFLMEEC